MKILFLSAQYPPETKGGGELSTHLIAQGLQQLGHDITVVTDGDRRGERKEKGRFCGYLHTFIVVIGGI